MIQKLTAQIKDAGGIPVARLIPQAGRRTIGAVFSRPCRPCRI
ncbi:hypothetical protein [Neisseria canis]|uniref:Uncharacterized protein n=1 Tax=Neisseria canis TaxID=493 RepID=A0A3S4NWH8_9NEIS|nr:hypothetical protein [Neisseria canis]VEF01300.1 Uncharacterised protein [Neisseria canis]